MRRLARNPMRVTSGLLALLLASAVIVFASVSPAAAHGSLAMSTPKADATVTEPLATVQLYFTEQVVANAYFAVTAPGGVRVDNGWTHGEPRQLDQPVREYFLVDGTFQPREYTTGYPAVVNLAHLPAKGRYTVSYLSVASDGEPVRGALSFRYTGPVTPAPAGWTPPTDQPDPALVAAVEQHGHEPEPSPTAAVPSVSAPPAAGASGHGKDPGVGVWTVVAAALTVTLVGLLLWRRPAAVGRLVGRYRATAGTGRRGAVAPRGKAKKTASRSGRQPRPARRATPTAAAPAVSSGADGRRRTVVVPTAPSSSDVDGDAKAVTGRSSNTRLALLVGGLVITLLAGFGLGRLGVGDQPAASGTPTSGVGMPVAGSATDGHQHPPGTGAHAHAGDRSDEPAGAWVSVAGYTLQPVQRSQPPGVPVDYQFRIVDGSRQAATDFAVVHEKPLHLIVVGRDLSGYQHLHPSMSADGLWSVPLELPRAGDYRLYADFSVITADGRQLPLVLGVDHHVPGEYAPAQMPVPAPQATVDSLTVSMAGTPTVGLSAPLVFRVAGASGPVSPERYLGAYGHLVVVREGDLGYVHVHPEPELVEGAVTFWVTVPSAGRYRAFFDFQVDGTVHTAEYTLDLS